MAVRIRGDDYERLVELAGMQEHCDFVTQSHTQTESGAIRPDMIINLPEGRQLVVDVKTPLDAYLEAKQGPVGFSNVI